MDSIARDNRFGGRHSSIRFAPATYAVHTQPGLEEITISEFATRCGANSQEVGSRSDFRYLGRRLVPGRNGLALVQLRSPMTLGRMRCAEDVFSLVGYRCGLQSDRGALERIRAAARDAPYVSDGLQARSKLMPGSRTGRRLTFRVIARTVGDHAFRRAEFARAITHGIEERRDRAWRSTEHDAADVEFWATLIEDELFLAIRLSDSAMRHRDYKLAHIPGSLRPSVAAALGVLSSPQADDVVLDPFCGAATVLIERAHLARYHLLIGSDIEASGLQSARANIGQRFKPIELHQWDAAALPLPDRSASRIITNLPWGKRHGSHAENRRLYPRVLREFSRLVPPEGKIVMLTGETRLMNDLLRDETVHAEKILRVSILGAPAAIYVCRSH
jgi:tRNA (guanine6-N2)-methyltransferase